jgi:isoleucyl-tRNA synthetase/phosphohistidine phosphatase SixA
MPFDSVDPRQSFPALEKAILQYWREEDMFRRSVKHRDGREEFHFYDGPPFATGLPHYGHLLAGTIKDVIPRYQTMRGKRVERRFGWDCHGLPIENLVEKEHGIRDKREIEEKGVKWFNDLCRGSVLRYTKEWRATVERMGRWVDMDWDYRTMDPEYMESIWWVVSALHAKGLVYEGHKPMHVCPRCVTPLSNFEVTQGYKDVTDVSVTAMFEAIEGNEGIKGMKGKTYFLAWTTTPWTLPGNLFLAVHPDVTYMSVDCEGATYIVAKELVEKVFTGKEHVVQGKGKKGKSFVGMRYRPLFPYFTETYGEKAFRVVAGDFVTTEDGTGLVHIAPGFGEDDYAVGKAEGINPPLQHVTMDGRFTDAMTDFAGTEVKPADDPSKTDTKIAAWLKEHGLLFASASFRHSYPHCWRCDHPLLNYATSSWFVAVEQMKEEMLEANAATRWVPDHLRDGRFGAWLTNARDWAISRNRYWGTPLPLWKCGDDVEVLTGRDDLMAKCRMRFTKLTAVRHGESEGNVKGIYQGQEPGTDLTDRGRGQAAATGAWLAPQRVDIIYCSPLARTRQTAQAIADATGARIVVDDRLRETGFGEHEKSAINVSDLALVRARRAKKLIENTPESVFHLPGMERWEEVRARIGSFLRDTLPKHRGEHVVVVSHADPIMNLQQFFTNEDPFKAGHQPFPDYAEPRAFFWDHNRQAAMDLHKDAIDDITWPSGSREGAVELTVVRHGKTDANRDKVVQGSEIDLPLNDAGREQALACAKTLKGQPYDVILCSHLARAGETADIIAKELGMTVRGRHPRFRERDLGTWSGRPINDVIAEDPTWVEGVRPAWHWGTPTNGESFDTFIARAREAAEYIRTTYPGKRVLLVTHGGFIRALRAVTENMGYSEAASKTDAKNCDIIETRLTTPYRRVPEVLDCWFESGAMPYAQAQYPHRCKSGGAALSDWRGDPTAERSKMYPRPVGFPADFIAEGLDQTRGWFYTLTVLAAGLFGSPAFRNCVVNGIVLAEDGKKMSKRLKNYPDPNEILERHGADALRFALMCSPAVKAEDLRFSERIVSDAMRAVLLPLWNAYGFFVTYANAAQWQPQPARAHSSHPLDRWIRAEVQDLVNRMTGQLDAYDLSATCAELHETIDALTNWYIRLSRRRFAGKGALDEHPEESLNEDDRIDALGTLYDVLLSVSQLLAPFCPYVTEAMYLNLVPGEHGSIHLTDWPQPRELTNEERGLLEKTRLLRTVVSLGLTVRSEAKVRQRQPLAQATFAAPPSVRAAVALNAEDEALLAQELNVKRIVLADDPGELGERILQVDARKVGPRMGGKVQEIIAAGKRGEFEQTDDGGFRVLEETLSPDEARVLYRGREGENVGASGGIVVSLDTRITPELEREGTLRELIRAVQVLRKDSGLTFTDHITLQVDGLELSDAERTVLEQEVRATVGTCDGQEHAVDVDGTKVMVKMKKM